MPTPRERDRRLRLRSLEHFQSKNALALENDPFPVGGDIYMRGNTSWADVMSHRYAHEKGRFEQQAIPRRLLSSTLNILHICSWPTWRPYPYYIYYEAVSKIPYRLSSSLEQINFETLHSE